MPFLTRSVNPSDGEWIGLWRTAIICYFLRDVQNLILRKGRFPWSPGCCTTGNPWGQASQRLVYSSLTRAKQPSVGGFLQLPHPCADGLSDQRCPEMLERRQAWSPRRFCVVETVRHTGIQPISWFFSRRHSLLVPLCPGNHTYAQRKSMRHEMLGADSGHLFLDSGTFAFFLLLSTRDLGESQRHTFSVTAKWQRWSKPPFDGKTEGHGKEERRPLKRNNQRTLYPAFKVGRPPVPEGSISFVFQNVGS